MSASNDNEVAIWNYYDSVTKKILEEGTMIDGMPQPIVGQIVYGVGDWKQAEVVDFKLKNIIIELYDEASQTTEYNIPQYDVFVKRLI